jgi:hypothetical protein
LAVLVLAAGAEDDGLRIRRTAGGGVRAASGVVLELGGCRLIVQAGFDAQLLRQVVAALRPA